MDLVKNKKIFQAVFELRMKQPWLQDKLDELTSLLYQDCTEEAQRELIIELISRFHFFSQKAYSEATNELVEAIITDYHLSQTDTQIVAMTGDYDPDSGSFVMYCLKPILEKRGWRKHLTCTNFQRTAKKFKANGRTHTNIVLVDEFVGSGQTAIGRVKKLREQYAQMKENVIIKVKVIAASTVGKIAIKEAGIDFECLYEIKRGISDFENSDNVASKMGLMKKIESKLAEEYEAIPMPSLGYGGTESLYCRADGNVPNSVFPVFWWPFYKDLSERKVLLTRAMSDA